MYCGYFLTTYSYYRYTSSVVYEVIRTISIILQKKLKRTKTQNNQFSPSQKFLCAKNYCLCCFLFACFCFVNWLLLVTCFCGSNFFCKKIEIVLMTSYTILLTCTLINPLIEESFSTNPAPIIFYHTHLFLIVQISSYLWSFVKSFFNHNHMYALIFICNHLWESLLFIRIFLNLSDLWESFLRYDHL